MIDMQVSPLAPSSQVRVWKDNLLRSIHWLEAISKLSFGLQKHLLTPNFVAKSLRGYGYALFLRLVQNQNPAFSPSKTFLRWLLVTMLLVVFAGNLAAQITPQTDREILTPDDYRLLVLQNHPLAQNANLLRQRASAQQLLGLGGFDPKLYSDWDTKNFGGSQYYTLSESGVKVPLGLGLEVKGAYQIARGINVNAENNIPSIGQASVGFNASLLQGMMFDQRRADRSMAAIIPELNEAKREQLLNDLVLEGLYSYWDWVVAWEALRILQEGEELAQTRLEGTINSYIQGSMTAVDTLETYIQLQNRQVDVANAQNEINIRLIRLTDFIWNSGRALQPDVANYEAVRLEDYTYRGNLAWVDTSLQALSLLHPELRVLQRDLEMLEIENRLAAEMRKPRLDVGYQLISDGADFFISDKDPEATDNLNQLFLENYKWQINFGMPLFWRKERGKYDLVQIKQQETRNKLTQKQQEIFNKVRRYRSDLTNLINQIEQMEEIVTNYERLLAAERRKFGLGESSVFLVNSREQKLIESQIKLVSLKGKYHQTLAALEWSVGQLAQQ